MRIFAADTIPQALPALFRLERGAGQRVRFRRIQGMKGDQATDVEVVASKLEAWPSIPLLPTAVYSPK
jgi:hypothetical protein